MSKFLASLQVLTLSLLIGAIYLSGSRMDTLREEVESLRTKAPAARSGDTGKSLNALRREVAGLSEELDEVMTAFEFLAVDLDGIKRNSWETLQTVKAMRGHVEPELPEAYKRLFEPETRDALLEAAAEKGVHLKEDRVEVEGVIVQSRAMLEFIAVVTGGKEHESIVAITGSFDRDGERLPAQLGATINACILALGYEKGTPVSMSQDGKVLAPQGMPIHVYLEWDEEGGERVRARAEDLVYNIDKKRTMSRDKWVYVGSRFEQDPMSGKVVYLADLTGDLVATYSWPNTIVDNTTSEAQDDIYYVCYTPRIPPVGTRVTMVLSKKELPARDFPEEEPAEDDEESGK